MVKRQGQPYRRLGKNGQTSYGPRKPQTILTSALRSSEATSQNEKIEATRLANSIDETMAFARYDAGKKRIGWLCNMHSTTIEDDKIPGGRAGVDYYFIEDDGGTFKATVEYDPYFLLAVKRGKEADVEEWCKRAFEGLVKGVKRVDKEDLQMPNHLLGYTRTLLQLSFANVGDLLGVRKVVQPIAEKNKKKMNAMDTYAEVASANAGFDIFDESADYEAKRPSGAVDASDFVVDIREYDVPYHVRVAIDKDIRIGKWYTVEAKHGVVSLNCLEERLQRADPVVMAFDIETTKLPLKFPDASFDQIMMISYMIDGQGVLITNREIVSEDIADFEYTPRPEYEGPFVIFNEKDERALLERFFEHIKEARPTVMVTYNGDFFDWPFVEARASVLGIDMYQEIGFRKNSEDIYQSNYCAHMDAFAWVNRDSYLPQGSRGLKAVTVAKLGYDPDELDPELMTPYASERPQTLAEYSVSDAVATYYLYMKYVHPFIFSLCTIIPLGPDDVLRKGTGTLCEMLLMVQAYQKGILLPNKHQAPRESFWEGHLLESETYVGGHVESIEAGVFRSDIPCNFALDTTAIDELLRDLDAALTFSIVVEEKKKMEDIENYAEVRAQIAEKLMQLKTTPNRNERPSIYHLDVASMYPNIMTTNRLQPDSMVQESDCAACDFNRPGKTCDRRLPWSWRGEFLPAKRDEYNMIKNTLVSQRFPGRNGSSLDRAFDELSLDEQAGLVKKRLQDYSKKIYHKIHDARTIEREAIICQRENPFYVNTVRDFRDRRYDFKGKQKVWKGKTDSLKSSGAPQAEIEEAKKMIVLFDSLQLAHKVILNSFYGYVMRKGSRWYSMEMAGVTCLTGARIIQMARQLVERIGRPLELDTDGIWCILPATFPENFAFKLKNGKKVAISYPCVMLNHLVHAKFTNHQYQTLTDPSSFRYETHSDNSIFFEVDGPYKAMMLPTSKEEDKNLKKRYAVFNHDGTLAELKGFEVKRRGELKLIKIFQTQIFKFFLEGKTLEECYASVAKVANRWLDVLHSHGSTLADEELIDLICENKNMTKTLEEYGTQKTTAITTAKRLAEFLGEQMIKDKGLNCKYIISSRPKNAPVTERAIPVAIFSAEESTKRHFMRKWLREDPGDMDPRTVIDWDYYLERLGSVIQKLITIPAALQKVRNPVPRVPHPDWLERRIRIKDDVFKQKKMTDMFESKKMLADLEPNVAAGRTLGADLEDFGTQSKRLLSQKTGSVVRIAASQKRKAPEPAAPVQTDPYASLPAMMPSITEDYQGWLKYQKKKWKIQKQARIRRRQLFGEKRTDASDAIGTFFRNQAELLYTSTWQLLQLRETGTAGEVTAFVLIAGKIHSLKVVVPRQLFVNVKEDDLPNIEEIPGCKVEKVVGHTLPNGHPSVHLFKMTMPEQTFVSERKKLDLLFNHPSVEGVYEKQLPLNIRALLELGSVCTFDEKQRGVLGKGLEQGFDLSALRKVPSTQPYLASVKLGYIYVYHLVQPRSGKEDKEIFVVVSPSSPQARIIEYDTGRPGDGWLTKAAASYQQEYDERLQNNDGEPWSDSVEYLPEVEFRHEHRNKRKTALEAVGSAVKAMRSADPDKSVLLVLQSSQHRMLSHEVPIMQNFPVLALKPDEQSGKDLGVGWEKAVCKRMVSHYFNFGSWITHLTELARYGDVPLCNLETHDPQFLIDVAYARRLQKEKVVLWWSAGAMPDHAGHERDDTLSALESVDMPSINQPGTYSTVCIDLSVRNLAINTILASALINEAEGSDSVSFNPAAPSDSDEGSHVIYSDKAFASAGIAVLRDMVKSWWSEACNDVQMADVMVQHLVRWVESPGSFLYDRALHYYVQMMSRKALQQLMSDFRRVGSNVVFASAHRLLLQTTKTEVGNAYAYSQYILKTVKAKPLFSFLELDIVEYWDYLAWSDQHNYGGMGCKEVVEADRQQLETIMHWKLDSYLPKDLRQPFRDRVVEFIQIMHDLKRPASSADPTGSAPPRLTQLAFKSLTEETQTTTPTNLLGKDFKKSLQKQISKLMSDYNRESLNDTFKESWAFPSLAGGQVSNTQPVLQLAKSIIHVFALDRSISLEVRQLQKQILSLFELSEFSAEASWVNPSASLKIEGLVCGECCAVRDLDLCRDSDVELLNEMSGEVVHPPWRCQVCESKYNRSKIEEQLVAEAEKMVVRWSTQDLKCSKCNRLRINDFMEHCACAGSWVETVSRKEVIRKIDVMLRIAKAYELKTLESVTKDMRAYL